MRFRGLAKPTEKNDSRRMKRDKAIIKLPPAIHSGGISFELKFLLLEKWPCIGKHRSVLSGDRGEEEKRERERV